MITSAAFTGSWLRSTLTTIDSRPVRSPRTRFFTMPEMRFEFGTMTAERSKVWISVERTEIRFTMPSESPITT